MDSSENNGSGVSEALPPPPPVPPNATPIKVVSETAVNKPADDYFYHYSVALFYEDGRPVDGKGVGRKVLDRVHETYDCELVGKEFAYDGEKSMFIVGSLSRDKVEFTVVLEDVTSGRNNGNVSLGGHESPNEGDKKCIRRPYHSKTFKVEISFTAKSP